MCMVPLFAQRSREYAAVLSVSHSHYAYIHVYIHEYLATYSGPLCVCVCVCVCVMLSFVRQLDEYMGWLRSVELNKL